MTTNFVLRQPKAKAPTPLNLRLTWKNNSVLFGTGIKIHPRFLLENNARNKDTRISNTLADSDSLNEALNGRRSQIESSFMLCFRYFNLRCFAIFISSSFISAFSDLLIEIVGSSISSIEIKYCPSLLP